MRRRSIVIAGLAALLVALERPLAQSPEKTPRVGILSPADSDKTAIFDAFRQRLHELGYVEGRNIILEFRLARGDYSRLPQLAAELAALPVDVILSDTSPGVTAEASRHIPIVNATMVDPVEEGFASSLSRPGANITGFSLMHGDLSAKRLELLHTAFPHVSAVAVLVQPSSPLMKRFLEETQAAARSMSLSIVARVAADTPYALRALTPAAISGAGAMVVLPTGMFWNHRREIVPLVNAARVPAIYSEREYADDGGLMAYGANVPDNFRRAAGYIDRILKGAKAGDLPIQQPVKFDFVINLKTAKALGLAIPQTILARADEVIE